MKFFFPGFTEPMNVEKTALPVTNLAQLQQLPSFAAYLRDNRLEDFLQEQLRLAMLLQVPIMQVLEQVPEEQRTSFFKESVHEFLTYLAECKPKEYIKENISRWRANLVPNIDKSAIPSTDITLITYVRKQALLHFAPEYCTTMQQVLQLAQEIDFFSLKSDEAAFETYLNLLQQQLEEQSYLTNKITNTSPGLIYLFSLKPYAILFANQTAENFFGISSREFIGMGSSVFDHIIHPDDLPATFQFLREISQARDAEVHTLEFRMKPKDGGYVWMRNYFSIFRRDNQGMPTEIIGNILNIQAEKEASEKLKESEKRYRQAEALTHIGHYEWNLQTDLELWSEELFHIYGIEPGSPPMTSKEIIAFTHPDDREKVSNRIRRALESLEPFSFYYRLQAADGRQKIVHSQGEVITGTDGKPEKVVGTLQDVTERQALIQKLRHSERMYKQAEELAHVGNFSWNFKSKEFEVSEEINRIYGLDAATEKLTHELYNSFIHPDDWEKSSQLMNEAVTGTDPKENIHRIIRRDGTIRYVYSVIQTQQDEAGNPVRLIGSVQDITERQQLIEQLQESQKLYQQAQSLAKLGNWSIDLKTQKVTWSLEMFHIYEYPAGDPPTLEEWDNMILPEDRTALKDHYDFCLANRLPIDFVFRITAKNGTVKFIHRRGEILLDDSGNAHNIIGSTQDVTEQYRVQQELNENQMFLRKITDATPAIITSYNVDTGRHVFVSEGLRTLLGYKPEQMREEGSAFLSTIIHPDDPMPVLNRASETLHELTQTEDGQETILEFSHRLRHSDGQYRWFHTYATVFDRNASGEVEHMLNISLDINEQKEASQKIEEQEQFIQNIADASPTILYVYDVAEGHFAYVNREIYFVLGYTPEEIAEMGPDVTRQLYHPDDYHLLPERKQSDRRIQQLDVMIQYECRMRHKSGEWQWFLVREVVFRTDDNERPLQIVGAALDISKRKEMEKTLLQNSFLLEQSNASLEEFAYVASHDLKEPLRKISTFGDRLAATHAEKLSPEGKIFLSKIIDASQRMQTMISDLLSISLISGNKSYEPYSLQKVLEETLQTLEFKIEQKNAVIISDGLPEAVIVVSQFRQLFQNLISNSLKFVAENVQPRIRIRHSYLTPDRVAGFQLSPANAYLRIEFSDNGIGFDNEYAGKIFLVFQRLHGRSEYEGSGIGLAICKKIVEHHGGIIYASGEQGKGATFTIILPAEKEEQLT